MPISNDVIHRWPLNSISYLGRMASQTAHPSRCFNQLLFPSRPPKASSPIPETSPSTSLLFTRYCNHLNTGLVQYLNGRFVSEMVQYLNGRPCHLTLLFKYWTTILYIIQMNPIFRCLVFRCLLYPNLTQLKRNLQ